MTFPGLLSGPMAPFDSLLIPCLHCASMRYSASSGPGSPYSTISIGSSPLSTCELFLSAFKRPKTVILFSTPRPPMCEQCTFLPGLYASGATHCMEYSLRSYLPFRRPVFPVSERWYAVFYNHSGQLCVGFIKGVKSLKKWFHRAEATSTAYFICCVEPQHQGCLFKSRWGAAEYKKGMKGLEETFDQYYAAGEANKVVEITTAKPAVAAAAPLHRYGSSFLLDAVQSVKQTERAKANPRDELKFYLSSPLEQVDNILHHWATTPRIQPADSRFFDSG
ncbi:hypothetical protein B0H14DRAFT_1194334 [Mycena olivaceomarginata]|nr:hypothetical protein B0H14DRAFT_1194334 [Mycena olivaceomarginata]